MTQTAAASLFYLDADDVAARAAKRAGVEIGDLTQLPAMAQLSELFDAVWSDPTATIMPLNLVRALSSAGSYVAGAYADGRMVGAILGFVGLHDGELVLHSHILGVLSDMRGRSVGFALKQHQRAWALARGITSVVWTFDPLVRRNAYFNLAKLGALGPRYEINFYGPMSDGINAGDETDRLVIQWDLVSRRVIAAADGDPVLTTSTAPAILDLGPNGAPVITDHDPDAAVVRCRVPDDIVSLRARDRDAALLWRYALRETLGRRVQQGAVVTGMDRDGWYTITRTDGG